MGYTHTIRVEAGHIDRARAAARDRRLRCMSCPVAQALNDYFAPYSVACVFRDVIRLDEGDALVRIAAPPEVVRFIRNADEVGDVRVMPFDFELTLP